MAIPERTLALPCRYYRVYTDTDVACEERNFHFVERTVPVSVEQAALVLVDVWSTHYIDSWLERARQITTSRIVPALAAARQAGLAVIHAPSPFIADRYETPPPPPEPADPSLFDWPPAGFRGIYRSGEHAAFGRNPEPRLPAVYARYATELDIASCVKPIPGELVIHSGQQMHEVLAHRGILHLIYAGFCANWCLIGRDYGIIAMNERGYNIILLRDATTGIEFHDTVETTAATEMTIREIETKYGWSATSADFVAACEQAVGER